MGHYARHSRSNCLRLPMAMGGLRAMETITRIDRAPIEIVQVVKTILLGHIVEGNPIRREDLAHETASRLNLGQDGGESIDRMCRRAIEWLRRNDRIGALIASVTGCGGYWVVGTAEEL